MRLWSGLAASCLVFAPAALAAQPAAAPQAQVGQPSDEQALAGFERYVEETLAAWRVPGVAVSVVRDGRVVLNRGYGVRDPDRGDPMTQDTIFPIASMSKAFTSFGAGLLVDEGRLSFDAPVSVYLRGLGLSDPAATQGLTLRDMLSHRSGMPRHDGIWYHNEALTREQLVERMPHLNFSAPLRARFQYNNIMFILSGLATERAAGQEWERFTEERIFRPLDMDRTLFSPVRAAADPNHSNGREVLNGREVTVPLFRNTPILNPAGGVYSTADDLANWMLVHLDGGTFRGRRIIQASTLADMHATHMPRGATIRDPESVPVGYGLGWFTDIYRGRQMVQHGGNLPGVSTLVALLPTERLGVTVLVNHGGSELRDALARQIIDRFLGEIGKDWVSEALARKRAGESAEVEGRSNKGASRVAGTRPSHALGDYAGTYAHPGYGPLIVTRARDTLAARYNDDSSPFTHFHYDVFDATTEDPENLLLDGRIQFLSDSYGRISGLQIAIETTLPPIVFERQPEARLSDPAYLAGLAGSYSFAGSVVTVAPSGNRLVMTFQGGQPAELIPSLGGEFTHPRRRDVRLAFRTDAAGRAAGFTWIDSSGVYEAPRTQ